MYKYLTFATLFVLAAAKPGYVEQQHHVIQPVVAKVGTVVHTAPSAVSHQSFTQVHNKAHIVTPVVHAVPVVKTVAAPVVHTYAAPTVLKTVHAAPTVVLTYAAPAVHAVPTFVKTVHTAAPVAFVKSASVSHHSNSQIHHHKTVLTPVVAPVFKSYVASAHAVPVVHVAPAFKTVISAPVAHVVHH